MLLWSHLEDFRKRHTFCPQPFQSSGLVLSGIEVTYIGGGQSTSRDLTGYMAFPDLLWGALGVRCSFTS